MLRVVDKAGQTFGGDFIQEKSSLFVKISSHFYVDIYCEEAESRTVHQLSETFFGVDTVEVLFDYKRIKHTRK